MLNQALIFDPIYKETIWGGRLLETMVLKSLPPRVNIGESWEISGCGKDQSIVVNKNLDKMTLERIVDEFGSNLLGKNADASAQFPLLYKLIDAHDKLSVQVHPSDSDAHANNWGRFGKNECWYIVHAEPNAQLIVGFKNGVTKSDVLQAIQNETLSDLLLFHNVNKGDMFFVPAGTVHALCGDTVIYEVQQTSDVTLRLYDWGRLDAQGKSRMLHIKESLQVLNTTFHESYKIAPLQAESMNPGERFIRMACKYFAIEEYRCTGAQTFTVPNRKSFQTVMVLQGEIIVGQGETSVTLSKGQSALLPAAFNSPKIEVTSGATFLISWIPDLLNDIIAPLLSAGYTKDKIALLGGNSDKNDLLAFL